MKASTKIIVGVDTGGTFTDFIEIHKGSIRLHKVASTPKNPAKAILSGLQELGLKPKSYSLVHGSTVATNAFLERKGARIALLTTKGFKDIIEIGRQNRSELYNLDMERIPPLVKATDRLEVDERVDYQGSVIKDLSKESIHNLLKVLQKKKIEGIAVCLLFSYVNNRHEREISTHLKKLGLPLSLSSDILPEFREYERCAATVLNAYLSPIMSRYLETLENQVRASKVLVMQSNGGVISLKTAKHESIRTLLSGPAGGVVGAAKAAHQAGFKKIITFDMGGTSTDVCLVDGEIKTTSTSELENTPIPIPMMPIHTVGAGGGSIAWIDPGGALRVGPESAGADPGPICYGKGKRITITDAHLYLGRIHPRSFLGGKMVLNEEKVGEPIEKLAAELNLKPRHCAEGILAIANTHMENAIRVISTQKGFDPREFTLVPFGGAGALHACEMARHLGVSRILVPNNPGILSAFGMAVSPTIKDYSKTILLREETGILNKIQRAFKPIKQRSVKDLMSEGFVKKEIHLEMSLDIRFEGQSFEINVPYSNSFKKNFLKAHKNLYGYIHKDQPIEVVTIRLSAIGKKPFIKMRKKSKTQKAKAKPFDQRSFIYENRDYTLPFFWRDELSPGALLKGPSVICEYSATTFIPPDFSGKVDEWGNLSLTAAKDDSRKT